MLQGTGQRFGGSCRKTKILKRTCWRKEGESVLGKTARDRRLKCRNTRSQSWGWRMIFNLNLTKLRNWCWTYSICWQYIIKWGFYTTKPYLRMDLTSVQYNTFEHLDSLKSLANLFIKPNILFDLHVMSFRRQ